MVVVAPLFLVFSFRARPEPELLLGSRETLFDDALELAFGRPRRELLRAELAEEGRGGCVGGARVEGEVDAAGVGVGARAASDMVVSCTGYGHTLGESVVADIRARWGEGNTVLVELFWINPYARIYEVA
jgi:hypothetical protein